MSFMVRAMTIEISQISKTYSLTQALQDISLRINSGEIVALIGPSGSGKSTLLRHIAGLELSDKNPDALIRVNGEAIQANGRLSRTARKIRSRVGVIFQQFNLVSRVSVKRNVLLGLLGQIPTWRGTLGWFNQAENQAAMTALQRVGLDELASQRASTLSGGQQQRVAIARSLMQQAKTVLADEPIASLDPKSAKSVMKHLRKLQRQDQTTVVITLHQVEYARKYCQRIIALSEGRIAFDGPVEALTDEVLHTLYGTSLSIDDDDDPESRSDLVMEKALTAQAASG